MERTHKIKKMHVEKPDVIKLREIDILLGQGITVGEAAGNLIPQISNFFQRTAK
jgi:hypothetical protein